ncbi:MAG: dTDP-4-dehydrorhamnose reductase [Pseudomonadota bacterium]
MRTILLTGKTGQVGWELHRSLQPLGKVVALGRDEMNLADPDTIRTAIRKFRPHLIVNAAAYTAVDKAEVEAETAMAVNAVAPGIMAEEAVRLNARLVHYSTDYVFDGAKSEPYDEADETGPLNVYGKSKLAGERAIQATGADYLIFRTSWVYGMRGGNFLLTMLKLGRERERLRIVNDQFGAPTWSRLIAEATTMALARLYAVASAREYMGGVYHMTTMGKVSWFEFARAIFEQRGLNMAKIPELAPIPSIDYPLPAKRPCNSLLSNAKFEKDFSLRMPRWDECLRLCMQES